MKLFSVSAFSGQVAQIDTGWSFADDRRLLVKGPNGELSPFRGIHCFSQAKNYFATDGYLKNGAILVENSHKRPAFEDRVLVAIVNDGFIKIPNNVYKANGLKMPPFRNKDGSKSVTAVCIQKNEGATFFIHVPGQKEKREITLYYDADLQTLAVDDSWGEPDLVDDESRWWHKLFPRFSFFKKLRNWQEA